MKIARVEAFAIRMPRDMNSATGTAGSPTRLGTGAGAYRWSTTVAALYSEYIETALVKVTLDDGTYGWGEAQAPLAPRVACTIVEDLLAAVLSGAEFDGTRERIEQLWALMYQTMRVRGQTGGFMLDAISGVDIALWDLAGKMQGLPVARLIRADARERVPAYLSGVAGKTPEQRAEYAAGYAASGFHTFKIFFDGAEDDIVPLLDMLRARLGSEARLALDALWRLSLPGSDALLRQLESMNLYWLECPFSPDDPESHRQLMRSYRFPLALGESYRTCAEISPFLREKMLCFVQPDLGRSGITETLRISELASRSGAQTVPHVSIALGPQIAAAVHSAAAIPSCDLCEYNPTVFDASNRYLESPLRVDGAAYCVPDEPGLGIDVQEPAVLRWRL